MVDILQTGRTHKAAGKKEKKKKKALACRLLRVGHFRVGCSRYPTAAKSMASQSSSSRRVAVQTNGPSTEVPVTVRAMADHSHLTTGALHPRSKLD